MCASPRRSASVEAKNKMRNPIAPAINTPIPRWWKIAAVSIFILSILTAILALFGVFHINKWGLSGPMFVLAIGAISFQSFIFLCIIKKWSGSEKVAGWDIFFFGFIITALTLVMISDLISSRLAEKMPLIAVVYGFFFLILLSVPLGLFVMSGGWTLAHPRKTPAAYNRNRAFLHYISSMKARILGDVGWTCVNVAVSSLFSEDIIAPWLIIVLISAVILLLGESLLNSTESKMIYSASDSSKLSPYEMDSSNLPKTPYDDDEPYDTSKLQRYAMGSANLPQTPHNDDETENH